MRAALVRCSQVVVLGLVTLQRRGEILLDGNGPHSCAAHMADFEDRPIEDVEDRERNQQIFGGFSKNSHTGTFGLLVMLKHATGSTTSESCAGRPEVFVKPVKRKATETHPILRPVLRSGELRYSSAGLAVTLRFVVSGGAQFAWSAS